MENSPSGTFTITIPSARRVNVVPLIITRVPVGDETPMGDGVFVGNCVSVGCGVLVGCGVSVGLRVSVGLEVSVCKGVSVGNNISVATSSSVGDGAEVRPLASHAVNMKRIKIIKQIYLRYIFFIPCLFLKYRNVRTM
jgi:UDP-3-O-[3-hydroxymyristoyl] glucosamine N-acyltransferase